MYLSIIKINFTDIQFFKKLVDGRSSNRQYIVLFDNSVGPRACASGAQDRGS